jgi:hypothetical protein
MYCRVVEGILTWGPASDPNIANRSEFRELILEIVAIRVLRQPTNVDFAVGVPVPVCHCNSTSVFSEKIVRSKFKTEKTTNTALKYKNRETILL